MIRITIIIDRENIESSILKKGNALDIMTELSLAGIESRDLIKRAVDEMRGGKKEIYGRFLDSLEEIRRIADIKVLFEAEDKK